MTIKPQTSTIVRQFLDSFDAQTSNQKLILAACTFELFRQAQTPHKNLPFFRSLSAFAQTAQNINWGAIPFSVTKRLLVDGRNVAQRCGVAAVQIDDILLEALIVFSDLIDDELLSSDAAPEAIFDAVIAEIVETKKAAPPVSKRVPEIYNERALRRVFKPAVFTEKTAQLSGANLVTFRDLLPNGDRGPSLRGVAFDNGTNAWYVLLETGEFVSRKKDDESVTLTNTADDYAAACPALLAFTLAASKELHVRAILTDAQYAAIADGHCLGCFTAPDSTTTANKESVMSLENVIDAATEAANLGITGASGPHGASVRFAIPATEFVVVLDAMTSVTGPYVVARLTHNDNVVMRLEHPRQFSARGVYMFPLADRVLTLNVLY